MDNIGLMSETVNFIQGSKRNYDSSTMQGGVYFSKDSKAIRIEGIDADSDNWTTGQLDNYRIILIYYDRN